MKGKNKSMENDYRTARERVSEERIRRMLDDARGNGAAQSGETGKRRCCMDSLAMVYSPVQKWQNINNLEAGFCAGTIFCELDKPFFGANRNGGVFNG